MAQHLGTSKSSQNLRASYAYNPHRLAASASSASLLLPHSASFQSFGNGSRARSSGTWTTSSGELGLLNNADEVEDRDVFVQEYNRLAKKVSLPPHQPRPPLCYILDLGRNAEADPMQHGVRQLVTDDFELHHRGEVEKCTEKRGWISRLLRSNPQRCSHVSSSTPPLPQIRHKRSVSELANVIHCRREPPKVVDLQEMVRLGGKSFLYLPPDYSPCSLILPTCIRATAQHLAQNVATRGLFRVPGSAKVISALFDYYCYMDHSNAKIASTVRCATLPVHIQYSTHDVASTFKRLLSVLPGGVLGSLSLFDAFIAIHSQLNGEPEYPRTKQTKVRARLIALAIGTVQSQQRRELICAVFGLLSLIGRTAEIAPREDGDGRPLPTADLMGYGALGIVFGPLLVGDLLERYTMKVATPTSGMLLFPLSPPRRRRDRRKSIHTECKEGGPPTVDRILVANDLTKMLISNWRDVVRQMRSLGAHCRKDASTIDLAEKPGAPGSFHPVPGFNVKVPKEFDEVHDRLFSSSQAPRPHNEQPEMPLHGPRSRRLKVLRRADSQRLLRKMSVATLSPTKEESLGDDESSDRHGRRESVIDRLQKLEKKGDQSRGGIQAKMNPQANLDRRNIDDAAFVGRASRVPDSYGVPDSAETPAMGASQVYLESVPPRESSRHASSHDDGRDSLSKRAVSEQSTVSAPLGSPRQESIARLEVKGQQQRMMDGKLTTPNQEKGITESRKRSEASSTASANTKPLSEGGIRLVQTSPVPAVRVGGPKTDLEGQGCAGPGSASKPFVFHDQGIQCQIVTEQEGRLSIDSTPERFYPFVQMSHAVRPITPDRGHSGHRNGARRPRQKQSVLLHGPRLSKSDENLRSQTCIITLQSPTTESTEAKELTKKGSVKAMAALFELQSGWRETAASSMGTGARSPRRGRHSKSDSAWTQRLDPLVDLAQNDWHMDPEDGEDMELTPVPSLGTMVPCPEQPPVAQHLNLARPPPSPSPVMEGKSCYSAPEMVSAVPISRAGSATVLYSQIRKLQRLLDAKTEEAAQLRRQLEAQKDSDVGTLSEQLRQAKRDAAAWRDRAEAAERRVKVFETFTEKLREIRDAVAETKSHKSGKMEECLTTGTGPGDGAAVAAAAAEAMEAMRTIQESRQNPHKNEASSTRRPDAQKRFPGLASSQDGADSHGSGSVTGEGPSCDGGSCACQTLCADRSGQIWAVVEGFLQMEEERMARET
ncbi:hypothetical protein E4U42_004950 [Claviceps africana]|uniref:Rho-GAP domain-containing protein n=1 Tax=Claviceps africana TaxID=83212 RepID=A0A8K0J4H0_9HYPO|nr:hypothetical protein E4U42_004950 [Claviceps africana]